MNHEYLMLDTPAGTTLEACPVCGSTACVYQYQKEEDGPAQKLICCSNGEAFGPQIAAPTEGCLLYMPPDDFYRATIREAAKYWNEYAKALEAFRRKKHWETTQVMREAAKQGGESNGTS